MTEITTAPRWRKKTIIEAVQFNGSNRREVLAFAYPGMSEDGLHGAEAMSLPVVIGTAGGDFRLSPGDWVTRENGARGVMDPVTFGTAYEHAGDDAPASRLPAGVPLRLGRCPEHPGKVHAQIGDAGEWACLRGLADVAEAGVPGDAR